MHIQNLKQLKKYVSSVNNIYAPPVLKSDGTNLVSQRISLT